MTDKKTSPLPSLGLAVAALAVSAIVGFAAVYVTVGGSDNAEPVIQREESTSGAKKTNKADNELAAFVSKSPPAQLAEIAFQDGAGNAKTLEDFHGKTVLLNLWATWCAPCKAEMPSLDRLQKQLGSDKFQVLALALDRKGKEAANKFLAETKSDNLDLYIDPTAKAGTDLGVVGMPTTILINPEGREIGRLVGPAEWDSPVAIRHIKSAIANGRWDASGS